MTRRILRIEDGASVSDVDGAEQVIDFEDVQGRARYGRAGTRRVDPRVNVESFGSSEGAEAVYDDGRVAGEELRPLQRRSHPLTSSLPTGVAATLAQHSAGMNRGTRGRCNVNGEAGTRAPGDLATCWYERIRARLWTASSRARTRRRSCAIRKDSGLGSWQRIDPHTPVCSSASWKPKMYPRESYPASSASVDGVSGCHRRRRGARRLRRQQAGQQDANRLVSRSCWPTNWEHYKDEADERLGRHWAAPQLAMNGMFMVIEVASKRARLPGRPQGQSRETERHRAERPSRWGGGATGRRPSRPKAAVETTLATATMPTAKNSRSLARAPRDLGRVVFGTRSSTGAGILAAARRMGRRVRSRRATNNAGGPRPRRRLYRAGILAQQRRCGSTMVRCSAPGSL